MVSFNIPDKMKAIVLNNYNTNIVRVLRSLETTEIPVPVPGEGQVLIRMEATPCNPSDIAFMRGMYNVKKTLPKVLGFEGSGTVVATWDDEKSKDLIGKRVSCFSQEDSDGTWAEYFITKSTNCIVIKDKLSIEQAGCLAANPFTAWGMMNLAFQRRSKAIIQTAASGQIGRFIQYLAKVNSITVINIVRKEEHIALLQKQGEQHVLLLNDEEFESKLKTLAFELNATTAFEAVGGEVTGQIFNAMPEKSEVILYGGLSGKPVSGIDVLDMIFNEKSIRGFNLNEWMASTSTEDFEDASDKLQDLLISKKIATNIQRTFSLDNVYNALRQYISNMSAGKIVFVF